MIRKIKESEFDEVFAIMDVSFPSDEYRTYSEQKALLDDPVYTIYVESDEDNIKAFITTYDFDGFTYVEHFAVHPDCRGGGIGAEMLAQLARLKGCRLCLEVEPPECEMAKRRIGFYTRNGFSLNSYPYIQPAMSAGKNAIPLMVMTTEGELTRAEFENIKAILYREVYHVV